MTTKTAPKADAVPTAAPALSFDFADAAVPETTRAVTAVNPMLAVCKAVADTLDRTKDKQRSTIAKTVTFRKAGDTVEEGEQMLARMKRWLVSASTTYNVTFRSIVTVNADDNTATLTFWAVTRVRQNRKAKAPKA